MANNVSFYLLLYFGFEYQIRDRTRVVKHVSYSFGAAIERILAVTLEFIVPGGKYAELRLYLPAKILIMLYFLPIFLRTHITNK